MTETAYSQHSKLGGTLSKGNGASLAGPKCANRDCPYAVHSSRLSGLFCCGHRWCKYMGAKPSARGGCDSAHADSCEKQLANGQGLNSESQVPRVGGDELWSGCETVGDNLGSTDDRWQRRPSLNAVLATPLPAETEPPALFPHPPPLIGALGTVCFRSPSDAAKLPGTVVHDADESGESPRAQVDKDAPAQDSGQGLAAPSDRAADVALAMRLQAVLQSIKDDEHRLEKECSCPSTRSGGDSMSPADAPRPFGGAPRTHRGLDEEEEEAEKLFAHCPSVRWLSTG